MANSHSNYLFNKQFKPEVNSDNSPLKINESAYDIEQCLMEIEESLLNIEQNLIYVQNLEIPQLNNLLQTTIDKKCGAWPLNACKSKSMMFNDGTSDCNFIDSLNNLPGDRCKDVERLSGGDRKIINFNSRIEERGFHRRRKNSLDLGGIKSGKLPRKMSLDHSYFLNNGETLGRRASHGDLGTLGEREKERIDGNIQSNCIFNEINERARDFRRKFDSICTARDDITNTIEIKIEESNERIYPIINSLPNSDNALVPGKLISLSFSLLLAALLQAVRCLADLVEDTFRSVALDKYALHD